MKYRCCGCHINFIEVDHDIEDTDDGVRGVTTILTPGAMQCEEIGHNHGWGDIGFACAPCIEAAQEPEKASSSSVGILALLAIFVMAWVLLPLEIIAATPGGK